MPKIGDKIKAKHPDRGTLEECRLVKQNKKDPTQWFVRFTNDDDKDSDVNGYELITIEEE